MSMPDEWSASVEMDNVDGVQEEAMARLVTLINTGTKQDGIFRQRIPGLYLGRVSRVDAEYEHTVHLPSIGIAVQGAKMVTVGKDVYRYSGPRIFLAPVALPIAMRTTEASDANPFLAIRIDLDAQRIGELALKVYPEGLPPVHHRRSGYIIGAEPGILNAMVRLVECSSNSSDADLLAPLVLDEILIRLLRSPIGVHVAELGLGNSAVQRVSKAIAWLQDHFTEDMRVAELAELVHMSESSFREHFKSVTSMSPLQYQKALRLQEARRLMLSGQMDATTACRLVGYVSDSQFNRDYSRFFGNPPTRDVHRLRQKIQSLTE